MKKKLIIEWDENNLSFNLEPNDPIRTREILGVLELVKAVIIETRKPENPSSETANKS